MNNSIRKLNLIIYLGIITTAICLLSAKYLDRNILTFTTIAQTNQWLWVRWLRELAEIQWFFALCLVTLIVGLIGFKYNKITTKAFMQLRWRIYYLCTIAICSGMIIYSMKIIFGRPRPIYFQTHDIFQLQWFQFERELHSFPSGHTSTAASIILGLWFLFPQFRLIWLTALLIWTTSNVLLQAHWLSDIMFATYIAWCSAFILKQLLIRIKKWPVN